MAYAAADWIGQDQIPVIDISPLRSGGDWSVVARAIDDACRNVGFLYISGHGIPQSLIDRTYAQGMAFFRRPLEEKQAVRVSPAHRGFITVGQAKMDDDALPDLKESFIWGIEAAHDVKGGAGAAAGCSFFGPNQWPARQPELRAAGLDYFAQVHCVAQDLLKAFALGLGLAAETFLAGHERPMSRASMVYYPPQDVAAGESQFGVSAHTDFGVLTVLRQDAVGGLQIQGLDGRWLAAPPIEGTLVVNVGDLLQRWTNGIYRSTPHRVVNASGQERLSLVCAYDPDFATVIDPAILAGEGRPLRETATTCGAYLTDRFKRAFAYRR